ncbi:solute carrier family 22 member 6 [Caerostris extrusa]|uniref:Solute carrier family 22 member 6 n=1 Tax=Caerostris extrusa TaxID=172846 RepID=A0AAV4W2U4_CAEEX|nr:solute carrier family 22 member 6 [Caerostris extrusa]
MTRNLGISGSKELDIKKSDSVTKGWSSLMWWAASGPWQRRVFVVFWFVNMLGIFQNFSITFLAPNMDFRCVEPAPWQNNSSEDLAFDARCEVLQEDNTTVKCTRWEYDLSETSETIVRPGVRQGVAHLTLTTIRLHGRLPALSLLPLAWSRIG